MIISARNSDLYEFTALVLRRTNSGIRVSETGEENGAVWLTLSQIEVEPGPRIVGVQWTKITAPAWLIEQKGLV